MAGREFVAVCLWGLTNKAAAGPAGLVDVHVQRRVPVVQRKVNLLRTLAFISAVLVACGLPGTAQGQNANDLVVKDVVIKGLERVSEQLVRSQLEVQPGQNYNPAAVARDIRRLHGLGHFDTIKVDASPSDGGLTLTYILTEKRIIDEVKIIGNNKVKTSKIRGVLSWKEGDTFATEAYDQERESILKLYQEKGFANTSVDINVEKVGPSRVRVTYVVDEGAKAKIRSIQFIGNEELSSRRLKKIMKTKPVFLFLGGKFNEEKLEMDLRNIVDAYGNGGHLEAAVTGTQVDYSPSGKKMDLKVNIFEGPQYKVANLEPVNNIVYDDDEILKIVKVKPGDVHNKGQVEKDAELIRRGYQDSGYVNADVTTQVTLDRENHTTNVADNISEGDLKYVRKVEVTGNETTKDEVVRREMMVQPGDRFSGVDQRLSQRRLENTRYFENVRLTLRDLEDSDLWTDVLVDVEEGKTGSFNFGAGYSTEEKMSGFVELQLNNFDITNWPKLSGGGQVFSTRMQVGAVRNQYNMSFMDPEFLGYPLMFGLKVFNESYKYSESANYTEESAGGQLQLGKSLSPFVNISTIISYTDVDYSDLAWAWLYTPEWRRELRGSTTIANSWTVERNTLDYYRDPSSGSKHNLTATIAGLGGDNDFLKVEHESIWYKALGEEKKWVLSFRMREGWAGEYGSSDYVPLAYRFYAGGTATVRGYDNRDIGPKKRKFWLFNTDKEAIGGNLRLVDNLEMKYKLNDMFRLYAFVDAGGVWEHSIDLGDMRYSTGLGFGVDVPKMGPIRIDYGIPLNPDEDQGNGRLHLMTGFRF